MLRHLVNFYVGKNMFEGGLQKVQNDGQLGEGFEETKGAIKFFGLNTLSFFETFRK